MAGSFSSKRVNSPSQQQALSLRVQTSVQGIPRPIVYGQTRVAGTLIDDNGFLAVQVSTSHGGKGGGGGGSGKGSNRSWNYYVGGIVSLGESIADVMAIYNGTAVNFLRLPPVQTIYDLATIGITPIYGNTKYYAALHLGGWSQYADAGWTAQWGSSRALAYRGQAYVCFERLDLGTSPAFPNFNFEVLGVYNSDVPALGPDANPADLIVDLLTDPDHGVPGFPYSALGDLSAARTYWRATGLLVSHAVINGVSAQSLLGDMMRALNADFRWSDGVLQVVPYADQTVSGNGYTYTPDLTPVYALTVDDFLPLPSGSGSVAVKVTRKSLNGVANKVQIEYLNRTHLYDPTTIYATDDASILASGRMKMSDLRQNHFFALTSAAAMSASLQLHRESMEINTYQCRVGRSFILLDVMDIVSVTEPALQLSSALMRITEIEEQDDQTLVLTMIEVPGTAAAPVYAHQPGLGSGTNANVPASSVNAPIFFEPPDQLGNGLFIWIGLSGRTPSTFGGCDVWMSSDGDTYAQVGTFEGSSRMGVTTSSITSVTAATVDITIDETNVLGVDLSESTSALLSGSPADLRAFNTSFVVDTEVIAYQTATLTGAHTYDLSTLARGGFGSTIAAHAAGVPFLRLDGNVFMFEFDASRIGVPLYFKFTSFNPVGGGGQNLADVGAYIYTPTGSALSTPLPDVMNVWTAFSAGFEQIYWDEVTDFRSGIVYEVRKGVSWEAALKVGTLAHPPFTAPGNGTYWIAAKVNPVAGMTVYSGTPSSIAISGNQLVQNIIYSYDEQAAGWPGTLGTGLTIAGSGGAAALSLDPSAGVGTPAYYTSANVVDVGYVAQASVSATSLIAGVPSDQNVLAMPNVLAVADFLGSASTAYVDGWVEINVGQPGPTWAGWQKFVPGVYPGQFFQFRLALETNDSKTIALVPAFSTTVQVEARIDHFQGLSVPSGGLAITFQPDGAASASPFNGGPAGQALPYVTVSWQPTAGDTYAITSFTTAGLTITFYNGGVAVARSNVNVDVEGY